MISFIYNQFHQQARNDFRLASTNVQLKYVENQFRVVLKLQWLKLQESILDIDVDKIDLRNKMSQSQYKGTVLQFEQSEIDQLMSLPTTKSYASSNSFGSQEHEPQSPRPINEENRNNDRNAEGEEYSEQELDYLNKILNQPVHQDFQGNISNMYFVNAEVPEDQDFNYASKNLVQMNKFEGALFCSSMKKESLLTYNRVKSHIG